MEELFVGGNSLQDIAWSNLQECCLHLQRRLRGRISSKTVSTAPFGRNSRKAGLTDLPACFRGSAEILKPMQWALDSFSCVSIVKILRGKTILRCWQRKQVCIVLLIFVVKVCFVQEGFVNLGCLNFFQYVKYTTLTWRKLSGKYILCHEAHCYFPPDNCVLWS